jgi:gliding motility-associated-like protein
MKMNVIFQRYIILLVCLFNAQYVCAQFGKDGDATIVSTNSVVNQYTTLQADANIGATQITVSNILQLNNPTPLGRGDLILIIQMQGANMATSNDINYGNIISYNGAGNYEYAYVTSVVGNTIQLSCGLTQAYSVTGRTQVIRVPQYQNLTINAGASITAPAWDGVRGGVVAIYAQNITIQGSITVNHLGFRGGVVDNSSANNQTGYVSTAANSGGEKGESIVGFQTEYNALGGRFGRGAPANGGGGGNGNNAAGGGGANAGVPANWFRGAGVMCATCTGSAAWALDPDYIANGNTRTNSSGGGRGGYAVSTSNQNALTLAPGAAGWGGDLRRPHGGLGGRPLDINPENRVFLGGGGGAGDQNNNAGGRGGNGGGIVFITANQISGTGTISANGENGANTVAPHTDAPGGAGGGGTIVVKAYSSVSAITMNANGGNGGNHLGTTNQAHGGGGGGGGGYIAVLTPSDASIKNVNGGNNGTTTSAALTEFPSNGATSGNVGIALTSATTNFILSCNLPPSPQNDALTVNEDGSGSGNLAINDTDLESLNLIYQAGTFTTTQGGTIVVNTDGTFTYTPLPNFNGTDTFVYQVCDGGQPTNQCATATLTITVLPVNDAPVAQNDNFSINENDTLNGDVSLNDDDGDPEVTQTLTYTLVSGGTAQANGTLVLNTNGTFSYTPNTNFNGTVTFVYQVCDNGTPILCATAIATIVINPINGNPIANDDNFTIDEDAILNGNVSLNDDDGDPEITQTLTYTLVSGGTAQTNGTLVLNTNGTFTYTPNPNFNGNVSFTYQVCDDGTPILCANAVANIQILPVNDAPLAQDDQAETNENQSVEGSLATNDTDIENDALSYLSGTFTTENQGQITIQTNGNFIYTPRRGFVGTDCFEYTVCDIQNACSKAKVCINVKPSSTVFVPEGFSPNGDGLYDSFVIEGIAGKKVTVKIYNRWGNLVYESADYKNDWKGTANMGLHTGENLPDGTYFYTIDLGDGSKPLSNYVIIKR